MKPPATVALTVFAVLFTAALSPLAPPRVMAETADISPTDRPYDHLRCYRITDPNRFGVLADLLPLQNPPFHVEPGCRIRATARQFCVPVRKRLGPLLSADPPIIDIDGQDLVNDYLCYRVRCPAVDLPNGWPVVDQFGRRVISGFKARRICTPTRKLPVDQACCDPGQEPGTGTIPPCVEGATCCNDGIWRCNSPGATSTCPIDDGRVCARCCNPAEEPGVDGNPICFEGHTCCASGRWQCNDGDGSSACAVDGVACEGCCQPSQEPGVGGNPFCIEGHTCCSDGTWRCNEGDGSSTCVLEGQACDCCDPQGEPGLSSNAICIEGQSCCANGNWQCNDGSGRSTCRFDGERCGDACGGIQGIPCEDDEYCVFEEGQCCCDLAGKCMPKPEVCTDEFDPVCGCDGVTYGNACEAAAAGVNVAHRGACEPCGGIAGVQCAPGQFCRLDVGQCCCDFQGMCIDLPQACPANVDPVCGCDGNTYGNACEAERNGVNIDHLGACANDDTTPSR